MVTPTPRYAFTVDRTDETVVDAVNRHGVAHLPGLLAGSDLDALQTACRGLIERPPHQVEQLDYSNGIGLRASREPLGEGFPALATAFDAPWMRHVADAFFDGEPHLFNEDVIVVLDVVGTRHAAHTPHYDRMPNLKFFVYLTDTTERNGAFRCRPGSHTFAKQQQRVLRAQGTLPAQGDTRLLPGRLSRDLVPVEGRAGTVLVIDSDVVHQGGTVHEGERLAVRSRSFSPAYLSRWA